MRIDVSDSSTLPVFEVDLEPPPDLVQRSHGNPPRQQELRVLFTKRNRVAVHDVLFWEMTDPVDPDVVNLFESKWSGSPAFRVVYTQLGCLPDPDCKFTWLRVDFDLGPELSDPVFRPIAWSLYPDTGADTVKFVRSVEVTSSLGLTLFDVVKPGLSIKEGETRTFDAKQYKVVTYGKMGPKPAWDLRATDADPEVVGDLTLVMVVAVKDGLTAKGNVSVSASVQLRNGRFDIPLVTKRTRTGTVGYEFTL